MIESNFAIFDYKYINIAGEIKLSIVFCAHNGSNFQPIYPYPLQSSLYREGDMTFNVLNIDAEKLAFVKKIVVGDHRVSLLLTDGSVMYYIKKKNILQYY